MSGSVRCRGRQLHYQPVNSHVHPFLVDLWDDVRRETDGAVDITVHADNAGLKASHVEIVEQLQRGEIEFYVLMGSILGAFAPVYEIQSLPFAFTDSAQVYRVMDGALGEHMRETLLPTGIYAVPHGLLENGFRQISTVDKPIHGADDLQGLRIRVPEGRIFEETFRELGSEPTPLFVLDMHRALGEGRVDGQENPLAITQSLKLYEVTRYIAFTNHMWSGFNLIANHAFWQQLPDSVREIVQRNVVKHIDRQRAHTCALNDGLEQELAQKGMQFTRPNPAGFRARLAGGFYQRWKQQLGATAWGLLEAEVGKLG